MACEKPLKKYTVWLLNHSNLQAEDTADEIRCKELGDEQACENLSKRASLIQSAEERVQRYRRDLEDCLERV